MRSLIPLLVVALLGVSRPSFAHAQTPSIGRSSTAPLASQSAVGVKKALLAPAPLPPPPPADTRQNRGMMIVGGAGLLTGALIGGDPGTLISVGGAVVFLWGLYQYLQ